MSLEQMQKSESSFQTITGHTLRQSSHLNLYPVYNDTIDDETYLNIFRAYVINDEVQEDVIFYDIHEITNDGWWDNISYSFYNDVSYWWVIVMMNDIQNPFEEIVDGQQIKVLKGNQIVKLLDDMRGISKL